eukprot:2274674-Pleurochrysis_carterae.AAC.3
MVTSSSSTLALHRASPICVKWPDCREACFSSVLWSEIAAVAGTAAVPCIERGSRLRGSWWRLTNGSWPFGDVN